jgi:hypothetical protein
MDQHHPAMHPRCLGPHLREGREVAHIVGDNGTLLAACMYQERLISKPAHPIVRLRRDGAMTKSAGRFGNRM